MEAYFYLNCGYKCSWKELVCAYFACCFDQSSYLFVCLSLCAIVVTPRLIFCSASSSSCFHSNQGRRLFTELILGAYSGECTPEITTCKLSCHQINNLGKKKKKRRVYNQKVIFFQKSSDPFCHLFCAVWHYDINLFTYTFSFQNVLKWKANLSYKQSKLCSILFFFQLVGQKNSLFLVLCCKCPSCRTK